MCSSQKNLRALIKDWLYRDITDGRTSSVVSYRIKQDHVRNSQPVWGHMQIDHVTRSISWPFESDQINCCCQCEQLNILRDKRTRWRGEFNIPAASSGLSVLHGRQFLASAENGSSGSLETRTWTGNGQKQAERASLMKLNVRMLQLFFIWNLLHIFPTSLNSSPNCKLRAAAASVTVSLTHTVAPQEVPDVWFFRPALEPRLLILLILTEVCVNLQIQAAVNKCLIRNDEKSYCWYSQIKIRKSSVNSLLLYV